MARHVGFYELNLTYCLEVVIRMLSPRQISVNGPFCLLRLSYECSSKIYQSDPGHIRRTYSQNWIIFS